MTGAKGEHSSRVHGSLNRRALGGITVLGLLSFIGLHGKWRIPGSDATVDALVSTLQHRVSATEIGRQALSVWPEMRDGRRLVGEILADMEWSADAAREAATDAIRNRLAKRIQSDFSTGRTVRLNGWILSLAEVRLCVLAALHG